MGDLAAHPLGDGGAGRQPCAGGGVRTLRGEIAGRGEGDPQDGAAEGVPQNRLGAPIGGTAGGGIGVPLLLCVQEQPVWRYAEGNRVQPVLQPVGLGFQREEKIGCVVYPGGVFGAKDRVML